MNFGTWSNEVNAAIEILKPAIDVSLVGQEKLKKSEVELKGDGTVVSIVDFACQSLIMSGIKQHFPSDSVLGEEEIGKLDDDFLKHVKSLLPNDFDPVAACAPAVTTISDKDERCWVIDPIDGTYGFVNGGNYAIAMALLVNRHVVCSAVAWPRHEANATGLTQLEGPAIFVSSEGFGAYALDLKGHWVKLSKPVNPINRMIYTKQKVGNIIQMTEYIKSQLEIKDDITMVSMTKGFVIASGGATVYIRVPWGNSEEHIWDIAPFELLIREAGGFATTGDGKPLAYRSNARVEGTKLGCIFTNRDKAFHDKVIAVYQEALAMFRWF